MQAGFIARRAVATLAAVLVLAGCASGPNARFAGAPAHARSDDAFAAIERGMTTGQVRERLGTPDETMRFAATHTTAWSYFYYDTWGFYSEESITFDDAGRVVGKFSKRIGYGAAGGRN